MRVLRFAALHATPWKNGGGTTVELAVDPPGAGLDAFAWRVSVAEVHTSGPFSRFEGIDRTLAILDGDGIALDFGDRVICVGRDDPPVVFPGESPVIGRPLGGFVRDVNVMTRRAAWRSDVVRRIFASGETVPPEGEVRIFVALGPCLAHCAGERVALRSRDAVVFDTGAVSTIAGANPAVGLVIALHRLGAK
jgi:uncharacterized protein